MAIDRPDERTLVFLCDACDETIEFSLDNDCPQGPPGRPNFVQCWQLAKAEDWITQKPIGYDWEHYCPTCAKLADKERMPRAR
jgi:hypothetical protein